MSILPASVRKRNGSFAPFDHTRIERAIRGCFRDLDQAHDPDVAQAVRDELRSYDGTPSVEEIQDLVERKLIAFGYVDAARAYMRYRDEHTRQRQARPVDSATQRAFATAAAYFPTFIQQLQFYDKYARFNYELGRRETWVETVDRSVDFLRELSEHKLPDATYQRIRQGILNMEVMPSMRLLAMAGEAARENHIALYNCSYMPVDSLDAFVEAMIISMCGCGVGYSVEQHCIERLPMVAPQDLDIRPLVTAYRIDDSSEGWASAWRVGLNAWFGGYDVSFDFSAIRPAGAPLRTKGGRASGPEPLRRLFEKARVIILGAQGRRLTSIECHDIMCLVGDAAVQGGVRRSAMIALFSWGDALMRHCKDGDLTGLEHRWNANNSEVWPDRQLSQQEVAEFVLDMHRSRRGEPGIFSRSAARATRPERRQDAEFGTNPCCEIFLRPMAFCNLSSVVCRADDTLATLAEKVSLATIIGTIQSLATNFQGLRPQWKANSEEERLLGVDLNGQMDCPLAQRDAVQEYLRAVALEVNQDYARIFGIAPAAAITCVKPSGNSSTLLNCSSGLHARWAPFYVRNVRISAHSPLRMVLKDAGVPMSPENGQAPDTAATWVVHVPIKAPAKTVTRHGRTALAQCDYWARVKRHWCEHNPSVSIVYNDDELLDIIGWVYRNQKHIGGMAFLPKSDFNYAQPPYAEIDEETYQRLAASFPEVDFAKVTRYEHRDLTTAAQEIACMSGSCDLV